MSRCALTSACLVAWKASLCLAMPKPTPPIWLPTTTMQRVLATMPPRTTCCTWSVAAMRPCSGQMGRVATGSGRSMSSRSFLRCALMTRSSGVMAASRSVVTSSAGSRAAWPKKS